MSVIEISDLSFSFGDNVIFKNASLNLFGGDKMGITGLNGAGKSTFIKLLSGEILPDSGFIRRNGRATFGYLDQTLNIKSGITIMEYLKETFSELYEADRKLSEINSALEKALPNETEKLLDHSGKLLSLLEKGDFYSLESSIMKVASGLGITAYGMEKPISNLSGGQRVKVKLARLLLSKPTVLLLDEPTNFLDEAHIAWLIKYLASYKGTYMIVSHDFKFLNAVTNCIIDIKDGRITRYAGNYESYLKQKEERDIHYIKEYNAQQREIKNLENYIAKNKVRASSAKMAKSRQKQLDKIERLERPSEAIIPTFNFKYKSIISDKVLTVNDIEVGYSEPLLPAFSYIFEKGEKIAVTGFNGIGKTTFLKTVCGIIPAISGTFSLHQNATVGYYEQENVWENPDDTALEVVGRVFPKLTDGEIKSRLSRCGITGDLFDRKISSLSGGEQAKVKICLLTVLPYSLLILDEPTNHLDKNAICRLKEVLLSFEGTVIFVSHDREFIKDIATKELNFEKLFD